MLVVRGTRTPIVLRSNRRIKSRFGKACQVMLNDGLILSGYKLLHSADASTSHKHNRHTSNPFRHNLT